MVGAVVAATLTIGIPQADAHWGWGYYRAASWGCAPCYTSWCTSSCDPCGSWYVGVRPGPIRRALFGPYRRYYGGWGCYSGWCGNSSWYSCSSCGYAGDGCCSDAAAPSASATLEYGDGPTPAEPPAEEALPEESPPAEPPGDLPAEPPPGVVPPATEPGTTGAPTAANSGLLTIWVPHDAKVIINGLTTRSTGSRRQYVSYGLTPGLSYKYEIRAQVVRDGRLLEDVRNVTLTAGQRDAVAFGFNISAYGELASGR